jgi:hypothetical protein
MNREFTKGTQSGWHHALEPRLQEIEPLNEPSRFGVEGWESDRVDSHFWQQYNDPAPVP